LYRWIPEPLWILARVYVADIQAEDNGSKWIGRMIVDGSEDIAPALFEACDGHYFQPMPLFLSQYTWSPQETLY
jgi:hypothetical protein